MSIDSRLNLALNAGYVALPETGRIAVFRPQTETDLSDLPRDRAHIITGFYPAHEAFTQQGFHCGLMPEGLYDGAIVFAARAKAETFDLIARACAVTSGTVIIDGAKGDGIESVLKACRKHTTISPAFSKAHGKVFAVTSTNAFADWASKGETEVAPGFVTVPGIFSSDAIDPASEMLAAHLPVKLGRVVIDLGAGWGYLAARALERESIEELHLIEAEHTALECARRNITDARAQFHWSDATQWQTPMLADTVIMNPPFHTTRRAEPKLGRSFIQAAAQMLKPRGHLWLVANRHLPYETDMKELFRETSEVGGDNRYKILSGVKAARKGR